MWTATDPDPVRFAVLSFWSIFVILDPVGAVPTFLAMTEGDRPQARVRMAKLASFVTFLVLLVFALSGKRVLDVFGVTMSAFEIAGGIILLKVALYIFQSPPTTL